MWYQTLLYILIVILMLAVLISIHEAGHLGMAKLFKVYCFEYSIGFGPAVLKVKRKKGETYFTLRAIPLGGYVSMYGEEGMVPEEGMEAPPAERSLANAAMWKKILILVAGVTLNFILGMILVYIGDAAFPVYYYARSGIVDAETSQMASVTLDSIYGQDLASYIEGQALEGYTSSDYYMHVVPVKMGDYTMPVIDDEVYFYVKDGDTFKKGDVRYVAVYNPSTLVEDHELATSIDLYPASTEAADPIYQKVGVNVTPKLLDDENNSLKLDLKRYSDGEYIDLDITFVPLKKGDSIATQYHEHRIVGSGESFFRYSIKNGKFENNSIRLLTISAHNSFTEGWQMWASDFPNACGAVVKGFISLFQPGGFKNLSGIVGITAAMPQITASGGARLVFFYAGMISVNLAFFNLLPFPGLDGWQILVTVIEGTTKKKVPEKAKTIATLIGFGLLIGLALAVTVKDVIALFI